jgi:4-methyl-5(b-hydroxyethyl)-thiazole monophosphate biosynthesis
MSKAVVFFADGTEECEALLVVDLLRRAKVEVIVASAMGRRELVSSHKIHLTADALAEEVDYSDVDMVILPGYTQPCRQQDGHRDLCRLCQGGPEGGRHLCRPQHPGLSGPAGGQERHRPRWLPGSAGRCHRTR